MKRVSFLSVVIGMITVLTLSLAITGWAGESHDRDHQNYKGSERQGGTHATLLLKTQRSNDHDDHDESGEERKGGEHSTD